MMDFARGNEEYSGHTLLEGGPRSLNIIEMSSSSFLAWKSGSFKRSSAKMQPTDHISTAVEYFSAPRRISGALQDEKSLPSPLEERPETYLYHSVTTSWVIPPTPTGSPYRRARPKSATIIVPRLFINRLLVFRSR